MRFQVAALLLTAVITTTTTAQPLPSDFRSIEQRSTAKPSEQAQVHAARQALSVSWPVERTNEAKDNAFDFTTDERTMQERKRLRMKHRKRADAGLIARVRQFVEDFMVARGVQGMIGTSSVLVDDEAPVLKPRKGMRYRFAA